MKIVESKEVYQCKLFRVTEDRAVDEKTGFVINRCVVRHVGSAVVLAVDAKGRVLMVRQYRLPAGKRIWEIPAGRLDEGETPLQAAKRELKEETGFKAKTWTKLLTFLGSPGYVQELMTIYLATGLTEGTATPMDDEQIESRWFTKKELGEMIAKGQIIDAKTMLGYYTWKSLK